MENPFIKWALQRFKEPSSWAGFSALLVSVGVTLKPEQAQSLISLGCALAGFLAVMLPERK